MFVSEAGVKTDADVQVAPPPNLLGENRVFPARGTNAARRRREAKAVWAGILAANRAGQPKNIWKPGAAIQQASVAAAAESSESEEEVQEDVSQVISKSITQFSDMAQEG